MARILKKRLLCAALTLACGIVTATGVRAAERDEIRALYVEIVQAAGDGTVFDLEPDPRNFTTVGALTKQKTDNALAYVNFLRSIAGLESVDLDEVYSMRAQHAACLLAANDTISHTPARCDKITDAMYETAYAGAYSSNLAKLQWQHPEILLEGISYFVRDDGDNNTGSLPHRRWFLDPAMQKTGFGLAYSENGNSFIAMYAVDGALNSVEWDHVAWPAEGIFPAELMRNELAWSVLLNSEIYDSESSDITVTLEETVSGQQFLFDSDSSTGAGSYCRDTQAYGSGWCLSFTPQLENGMIRSYQQNQKWHVKVEGLKGIDGSSQTLEWDCNMVSLTRQAVVNVELSTQNLTMRNGETKQLSASVVPVWADDLSVRWETSDPTVATVDNSGNVYAVATGNCEIRCVGENEISDTCEVRVN